MATSGTGESPAPSFGDTPWNNAGDESRDRRAAGGGGIAQTLRDTTYRRLDDQKARASDTLGSVASAVRGMTQPLRDGGQAGMADYVNKAADGIERWASDLKQQDIDAAVRAVQQFARRQPALFLGAAFATGMIAARFLKSSAADDRAPHYSTSTRSYGGGFTPGSGVGAGPVATHNPGWPSSTSTTSDIPRVASTEVRREGEVL